MWELPHIGEGLDLDRERVYTDFRAFEIIRDMDRFGAHRVALTVNPVRPDDLKPLCLQLRVDALKPVCLKGSPGVIPCVEQERSEQNAEIRHKIAEVQSVRHRDHGIPRKHLINQIGLVAQLAGGI